MEAMRAGSPQRHALNKMAARHGNDGPHVVQGPLSHPTLTCCARPPVSPHPHMSCKAPCLTCCARPPVSHAVQGPLSHPTLTCCARPSVSPHPPKGFTWEMQCEGERNEYDVTGQGVDALALKDSKHCPPPDTSALCWEQPRTLASACSTSCAQERLCSTPHMQEKGHVMP